MANDGDNLDRPPPWPNHWVTREEYDALFNSIVRLTDRIEVMEKWARYWGDPHKELTDRGHGDG